MKKIKFLMTILAEIRLSLHMDDDDSGSTRQQKRQEGDSVKPCQERTVGSKKWGSCYATGGGALEVKYEGNAQVFELAEHREDEARDFSHQDLCSCTDKRASSSPNEGSSLAMATWTPHKTFV